MAVLVTGGLGYIGSHVTRLLEEAGDRVVVIDRAEGPPTVGCSPVVRLDLAAGDAVERVREVLGEHQVDAIVHLAALKQVEESVRRPLEYYGANLGGLVDLLSAVEGTAVSRFVFSSSAAVYGEASGDRVDEDAATNPVNPYGRTKLAGEWLVRAAGRALGIRTMSLRYFNVAGAGWADLGDRSRANLVGSVIDALDRGERPAIYGVDYPTADGTARRDFVHVLDLAAAHLRALEHLRDGPSVDALNIGTGSGTTVRTVVDALVAESGRGVIPRRLPRRAGDTASVVADTSRARSVLGLEPGCDVASIVASAWEAHRRGSTTAERPTT